MPKRKLEKGDLEERNLEETDLEGMNLERMHIVYISVEWFVHWQIEKPSYSFLYSYCR